MDIFEEADKLIGGDRQNEYGAPDLMLQRIATIWEVVTGCEFTPAEVSLMLAGMKMARLRGSLKEDTLVDLVAYVKLAHVVDVADKASE
jgi:hypothetical protein